MTARLVRSAVVLLLAGAAAPALSQGKQPDLPRLMNPRIVAAMPAARPSQTFRYGDGESQIAELFLPRADPEKPDARPPVIVMIHGGCWRKSVAGMELLRPAATAFMEKGYAVWSIGYRRIDEEGGGYPGTYRDVATAIDSLREVAEEHQLDLNRVIFWGHSAGTHLALWAAGRHKLPESSPMRLDNPLKPRAVIGVGGIARLAEWERPIDDICGADTAALLAPPKTAEGAERTEEERFADTSPDRLLPMGVPVVLLHGVLDGVAFPAVGFDYIQLARRAGDRSELQIAPVSGHFEVMAPGTPAFAQALNTIERLAKD